MISSIVNVRFFYKITRYIFGLNKAIKPHLSAMNGDKENPFRQTKASQAIIEELGHFRQQQTRLGAWLTGTDRLIRQLHEEINAANQQLEDYLKKKQSKPVVSKMDVTNVQQTHAEIKKHLEHRLAFLEQAPPKKPLFTIPHVFEIFGRNNQIYAQSLVNAKKPANYRNLIEVQKKNQEAIDTARAAKKESEERINKALLDTSAWPHTFGGIDETWSPQLSFNTVASVLDTRDDPIYQETVDGADCAQRYAEAGLKWLKDVAPTVSIDEKGKPAWKPSDVTMTQEQAIYPHRKFR